MTPRYVRYGLPQPPMRSNFTTSRFAPVLGYTNAPDLLAPLGSLVSSQNVWVRDGRLEPRTRLARYGTGPGWNDVPNGAFLYDEIDGTRYPIVTSKGTVAYLAADAAWTTIPYQLLSATTNRPPTGGENDLYFGTTVYLERLDDNIALFTNGVDPMFAWRGPESPTFSTLTQAPICKDVALFDNRPIAWNIYDETSPNRFITRVAWSVRGDPEDWTGIGSGTEDLVDMRGFGTRIFATEDELVLFSSEEIWRGRKVGLPYVFAFQPLAKEIGAAHARPMIQTSSGIYWLDRDDMVYQLHAGQIAEVGAPVQRELHDTIVNRDRAFFTTHEDTRITTLWYSADAGEAPNRGFSFNALNNTWAPHRFGQRCSVGFTGFPSSSATTWGGLSGTLASQALTYNELLGNTGDQTDAVVSSAGTPYLMLHSATSDDGVAVLHEAQLGAFGAALPMRQKHLFEVRVDARAESASSLSIGVSHNLGGSFPVEQRYALSVQSATTQHVLHPNLTGTYMTTRIRDDSGGNWAVSGIAMTARISGEP